MTAEYSMLPGPTGSAAAGTSPSSSWRPGRRRSSGWWARALRAAVDSRKLGERTITIDCDVLQGDGGTRTASVTGGYVALALACRKLMEEGVLREMPLTTQVAAVSAGIVDDVPLLDLCYEEDSGAMVDLNCVMTREGDLVELRAPARAGPLPSRSSASWWTCAPRGFGSFWPSRRRFWKEAPYEGCTGQSQCQKR